MGGGSGWMYLISGRVTGLEEKVFSRLGKFIGKRPVLTALVSSFVYFALMPGVFLLEGNGDVLGLPMDTDFLTTFTLEDSEEFKEYKETTGVFPDIRGIGVVQTPLNGVKVISADILAKSLRLDEQIQEFRAKIGDREYMLGDLCVRTVASAPCSILSAAGVFLGQGSTAQTRLTHLQGLEADATKTETDRALWLVQQVNPQYHGMLQALVATPQGTFPGASATDNQLATWLLTGRALTSRYDLTESNEAYMFEVKVSNFVYEDAQVSGVRFSAITTGTIGEECAKIGKSAIPLLIVAVGTMIIYVVAFLGADTRKGEDTQVLMILVGVSIPALSSLASMGAVGYMGMNLNVLGIMAPFLGLAVGVDAVFLVTSSVKMVPASEDDPSEVMANAVSRAGVAATTTTFTSVLAFGVSAITTTNFPGFFVFNIMLVVLLILNWIGMVALLPACAVLNERRIAANRMDLLPCVKRRPKPAEEDGTKKLSTDKPSCNPLKRANLGGRGRSLFCNTLAPLIEGNLLCQVVGVILWVGLVAGGGALMPKLGRGMPDRYFIVDSSPVNMYLDDSAAAFGDITGIDVILYLPQPKLGDPVYRQNLVNFTNTMSSRADSAGPPLCWPALVAQQLGPTDGDTQATAAVTTFFQDNASTTQYSWDAKFGSSGALEAARCHFLVWQPTTSKERAEHGDSLRAFVAGSGLSAYLTHQSFPIMIARYNKILEMVTSSAGFACLAVFVALILTLPIHLALLAILNVAAVVIFLFGYMVAVDITCSAMSFTVVLMAIGFCVDYTCHAVHFADHNIKPGTPWDLRMGHSLRECGFDVFQGCATAFLGVALLGLNQAEAFRIFASMALMITGVGGLFALWGLPAMLALSGRFCCKKKGGEDAVAEGSSI